MQGLGINTTLYVTPYPSAWRIQLADNDIYRGFEYVRCVLNVLHHNGVAHRRLHTRFHWGTTDTTWDLWGGCKDNGALVRYCLILPTTICGADQFISGQIWCLEDGYYLASVEVDSCGG